MLYIIAGGCVVGALLVVAAGRVLWLRWATRRLAEGRRHTVPCWLAGPRPYPHPARPGRLRVAPGAAVRFVPRLRWGSTVTLPAGGLSIGRAALGLGPDEVPGSHLPSSRFATFDCRDGAGLSISLVVAQRLAVSVRDRLEQTHAAPAAPPAERTVRLLGRAADLIPLWTALVLLIGAAGPTVADLLWPDAEPAIVDLGQAVAIAAAVAGIGSRVLRRLRSPWRRALAGTAPVDGLAEPPPVFAHELTYSRVAEVMAARAAYERWDDDPKLLVATPLPDVEQADPHPWWRIAPLRRAALTHPIGWPIAAGCAALTATFGLSWWLTAWALVTGPTATTYARVLSVSGTVPWLPQDAEVVFNDGSVTTSVPARSGLEKGDYVPLTYATDSPARARLGEHDGHVWGAGLSGLVFAGASGWVLASVSRGILRTRRLHGVVQQAPRTVMHYVQAADPELGVATLLLFPIAGDLPPAYLLPLLSEPSAALDTHGIVELRGLMTAGKVVVPIIGDQVLWPEGRLETADRDRALAIVNGKSFADYVLEVPSTPTWPG